MRPSNAAEVVDSLEAMARTMQSAHVAVENEDHRNEDHRASDLALPTTLKTYHGATQLRGPLKRRAFLAHSIGLLGTAGVSMLGGSALGKRWSTPQRSLDTFVPGWDPKYKLNLEYDRENLTAEERESLKVKTSIRSAHIPIDLAVPTRAQKWIAVTTKPFRLPDDEILITLINGAVEFNCNPGDAEFVLESKLSTDRTWTQLVSFRNHFGGLFGRAFDASLPRSQVKPNELVCLRARVRYRGATVANDAYPVGVRIGRHPSMDFMTIDIWCRKEGR
ncbi:MAG: hypothetical protein FJ308_21085 [Planctomycetes bacterium]|nr:hypothetical protein [Planctomycetota bacterium]